MARRLIAAGIGKEDRVALIAETGADFAALFCACVYAGAWPVPLPLPTSFGGKDSLSSTSSPMQLNSSDPKILLLFPAEICPWRPRPPTRGKAVQIAGSWASFFGRGGDAAARLRAAPKASPDDICLSAIFQRLDPLSAPVSSSPTRQLMHEPLRPTPTHDAYLGPENDRGVILAAFLS